MSWHGSLTVVLACVMTLFLNGCQATPGYPGDWPAPAKDLIGKCPSIVGTFGNVGISHPKEAQSPLLTQLLDLPEGERVEITQSPAKIGVTVWNNGKRHEEVTFTNVWLDPWADRTQPRSFVCPIALGAPSGRALMFSHLVTMVFGIGVYDVLFSKAADGSLIVTAHEPVGAVYYRFARVDP